MNRTLLLPVLLAAACADPGASSSTADAHATVERAALDRAHEAYLAGDFLGMSLALKEVLAPPDADVDVRANALSLLDEAYELKGGHLPADFALPPGLAVLDLGQVRVEQPDETSFVAYLAGRIDDPGRIQQLRVTRGGEIVLDAVAGKGRLRHDAPDDDGMTHFSVELDGARPLDPGVYGVHVELASAPPMDGWVIVGDLVSSAAPRIRAPGLDAAAGRRPTLSFEDFTSPAYRPFERRTLYLAVSPQGGGEGWSLWTDQVGFTEVVVGDDPRGPATTLSPGRYWINVSFTEKRRFGPMQLSRQSRTLQPFQVR